jgi:predicted dehydrogenase
MKQDHTQTKRPLTRREFLRRTTHAALAATAPMIVPGRVLGLDGGVAPSNRITIGFIGTGRQAYYANIPGFLHQPDAQALVVCDVDQWRMNQARERIEQHYGERADSGAYKGCVMVDDWREVIARDDVDAVMISTPDHWHVIQVIAAVNAGKDVSCEKPLTRSIAEGRKMVEAVQRTHRVFCTDSEFRTYRWNRMTATMARNGKFGRLQRIITLVPPDPTLVTAPDMPVPEELNYDLWQGPALEKPYTEKRVHPRHETKGRPGWLCIRDYADGIMANWGAHWNDIAMWAMDTEKTGPVEVEAKGTFPPKGNFWNVVLEMEARCRFANGVELVCKTGKPGIRFEGTQGWAEIKYPGDITIFNEDLLTWEPGPNEIKLPSMTTEKRDFLDAVKSRTQPQYDAEGGHRVNSLAHLANASMDLGGRVLKWDPVKETVIGDDEANDVLQPKPLRAPWKV